MDRLSADVDPSAKYVTNLKLWIYLHSDRSIDDPKWNVKIDSAMEDKW
jgi:hypothetical protein